MTDTAYDVLVLGGGSAGCVLAARLSEDDSRSVCLVEAGPDYGPFARETWPADILDARLPATSHDWDDGEARLAAARILGGCSAHNMCTLMRGGAGDYDHWAEVTGDADLADPGFAPCLDRTLERMVKRRFTDAELDPWLRGLGGAASEIGMPVHEDGNAPSATEGLVRVPFNLEGTTRWNAAFEYLDPARNRPNLTVLANTIVDRITFAGDRATAAEVLRAGESMRLEATLVVLSAGAYGSPAVLLRSGVGPEAELRRIGTEPVRDLPVGTGLRDHFGVPVRYAPSDQMSARIREHRTRHDDPTIQGFIKARTSSCPPGTWDLHLVTALFPGDDDVVLSMSSMLMQAEWSGSVRLRSADPTVLPEVSELDVAAGGDAAGALEGVDLARELVATGALADCVDRELAPGAGLTPEELRARGRDLLTTYFHPVGTCAMGAVTDSAGRVHGLSNLHVVDASVIPKPLRSSPHLSVLALAERAGGLL